MAQVGDTVFYSEKALTRGIVRTVITRIAADGRVMLRFSEYTPYVLGRDVFTTEAEAREDAETRRRKRIQHHLDQVAALRRKTIVIRDDGVQ